MKKRLSPSFENGTLPIYWSAEYASPVGRLTLACDGERLTGLWIDGQKYFGGTVPRAMEPKDLPILVQAREWLDRYFAGEKPDIQKLPLAPAGTLFQQTVWKLLREIPYGEVVTYGALAQKLAAQLGRQTSGRAVGGAVGRNPISIIIPCHRVIGADGSLTGYAGGTGRKRWLLEHEGAALLTKSL